MGIVLGREGCQQGWEGAIFEEPFEVPLVPVDHADEIEVGVFEDEEEVVDGGAFVMREQEVHENVLGGIG